MSGADGLVSAGASALPELFSGLVDAEKIGDSKAALLAQSTVQKVKDLVKSAPIPAYYEILRERGLDCGVPRPPFLPLAKEDSIRMIKDLRELRLI
jgi:dihydrodipicolinate synthase/N-acetylneuraminate lyase